MATARRRPAFNDGEIIEVCRRIEREAGSTYRVNGREVRARDVQLLFADASTGARSTAMVRQGQIGEIIAAKPQERRRILEEAAGIAGLHSRRHEAELRLKAAEDNLTRLDDILQQIDYPSQGSQETGAPGGPLPRARRRDQAQRGLACPHSSGRGGNGACNRPKRSSKPILRDVAEKTGLQAETAGLQAIAAHELPSLRGTEAEAAPSCRGSILARETLDGEERRAQKSDRRTRAADRANDKRYRPRNRADRGRAWVLARLDAEAGELDKRRRGRSRDSKPREAGSPTPKRPSQLRKKRSPRRRTHGPRMEARRARSRLRCGKRRPGSHGSRPKSKR